MKLMDDLGIHGPDVRWIWLGNLTDLFQLHKPLTLRMSVTNRPVFLCWLSRVDKIYF
jgi:hypothetical protein